MREKRKPEKSKDSPDSRWDVTVDYSKSIFEHGASGVGQRGAKVTVTDLRSGKQLSRFGYANTKNDARQVGGKIANELIAELSGQDPF